VRRPTQISNWDGPEPDRWTRSNPPRGPSEGFSATRPSTPSDRGGGRPPLSGMYNGVGLQTPRGSGTTGHVQASKFLAKPRPSPSSSPSPSEAGGMRKPNKDIIEHDRKRQVELRLLVLIDALEEQGYTEAEIEARVDEARKAAEAEAAAEEVDEGRPPLQRKGYGHIE